PEDINTCRTAGGCGAALLATAHAGSERDWEKKPFFRALAEEKVFERLIWIAADPDGRSYREVRL
ncbi:MAG: stage III sporulation protein AB, partial [Oscillospiraceae bacterium]|nr:stage III sporulation protein AB [Oscillospiraceae bacterium]